MLENTNNQETSTSHFDAAKVIVDTLRKLDKASQTLAMRFAAETLGLQAAPPQQQHSPQLPSALPIAPPASSVIHSSDIKQFATAKAPKSDQQFAAVVAYFFRFEAPEPHRKDTIDANTLIEAARLAGRRRPSKAISTLNNAKTAGYLDSAGHGEFRINSVGENLVAMALPGDTSSDLKKQRNPRMKVLGRKLLNRNSKNIRKQRA